MKIIDLQLAEAAVEEYIINSLITQRENKMPGRYDSNPAEVTAGFTVYPEGEYVVEIGEPKAGEYKAKDELKAGIRFPLRIAEAPAGVEGNFKGKVASYFGDELNDFGKAANKRLVMASQGFEIKDEAEKQFNTEVVPKYSWGFNTADGTVDEGWLIAKGKVVYVKLGINIAKDGSGKQFQSFDSFRPYPGTGSSNGSAPASA